MAAHDRHFYVIAYDISDNKRRKKIHNLLSGYCTWTQYSLFEGFLTDKQQVALEAKLCKIIDEAADSLRFYPLCAADVKRMVTLGSAPPEDEPAIVV
jgi:CRISPR-associated protein Cas2